MTLAARPALAGLALTLGLSLAATACTGGDDGAPSGGSTTPPAQPTESATTFEIETKTTFGAIEGRLPKTDRRRLQEQVTGVVQRWFNAAYVGGDFPRGDFSDAFPGFTERARAEARRDRALMTNVALGKRVDDVTATRSRIWLDVLAVRQRAVGVTARFDLAFSTTGEVEKDEAVRGRLVLTRTGQGWKIFGYDVNRGGRA